MDSEEPNSLCLPYAGNKNMHNCPDRPCLLLTASCMNERACLHEHQPESFKGLLTGNYEPKKMSQVLAYPVSNPSPSKEVEWSIAELEVEIAFSLRKEKIIC